MIPNIYKKLYDKKSQGRRENHKDICARMEEVASGAFHSEAENVYEMIKDSSLLNCRPDGLPIQSLKKKGAPCQSDIFSESIFMYISALAALGMHDDAMGAYVKALDTSLMTHREDGIPVYCMNIKGQVTSHCMSSLSIYSYVEALCSLGLHDKAMQTHRFIVEKSPLFRESIGILPGWHMDEHWEKANYSKFSFGIFPYINALQALGLEEESFEAYWTARETTVLTERADGIPVWGEFDNSIVSTGVFAYIQALCNLGRKEEALDIHRKIRASSMFTYRNDGLPSYYISADQKKGKHQTFSTSVFTYIKALMALHNSFTEKNENKSEIDSKRAGECE